MFLIFKEDLKNTDSLIIPDLYVSKPEDKIIEKYYGLVQYSQKGINGSTISREIIKKIFNELLNTAKSVGANAVINVRIESGSYQVNGSALVVTYIIAYGDAVYLTS